MGRLKQAPTGSLRQFIQTAAVTLLSTLIWGPAQWKAYKSSTLVITGHGGHVEKLHFLFISSDSGLSFSKAQQLFLAAMTSSFFILMAR